MKNCIVVNVNEKVRKDVQSYVVEYEKIIGEELEIMICELTQIIKDKDKDYTWLRFFDTELKYEYEDYGLDCVYENFNIFKTYIDNLFR